MTAQPRSSPSRILIAQTTEAAMTIRTAMEAAGWQNDSTRHSGVLLFTRGPVRLALAFEGSLQPPLIGPEGDDRG